MGFDPSYLQKHPKLKSECVFFKGLQPVLFGLTGAWLYNENPLAATAFPL